MDHSNPVADSTRKTVRDIMSEVVRRRRQDLEFLGLVTSGAPRTYLPALENRVLEGETLGEEVKQLVADRPTVSSDPVAELPFLEDLGEWPVTGLLFHSEPVHPPGVHQLKGSVSTVRNFGGSNTDLEFARRALEFRPYADLKPSIKTVYTRGTATGFVNRLMALTTRKVPQMTTSLACSKAHVVKTLKRLLPVDLTVLEQRKVTWHDDLAVQLDEIQTSSISSAGAPYWVKKPQALPKLTKVVLPLIHRAISEGKLGELFKQQPELFLGEVKNKLDRYDRLKLDDKTRPYFGMPFHFQALFSMMSQPFTEALEKFWQGEGCNAYGHSWAHGGCEKLRSWAMSAVDLEKRGRPLFCAYGDDVDVYYRTKGKLMRISPDFRQMDGSIDETTVECALAYVESCLEAAWGDNPFFKEVIKIWKEFATDPHFLVSGPHVYRKKQKNGLMTGVVGTTLFDTAKSVLAYDAWADEVAAGRRELLQAGPAAKFFADKFGLVVKEGTWDPVEVVEERRPNVVWAPTKFLGVYFMYVEGPQEPQLVPYLNDEEWIDLIMNPRDDPAQFRRGRPKDSQVSVARRWYDRMRGYMVTGAFSNPLIRNWVHGIVNNLDPVSIVMSVLAGGGKGESPGVPAVVPEDFSYPDSSGFPSYNWCLNLYFTEENQWPDAEWIKLFPSVDVRLEEFRRNHKSLKPVMMVLEASAKHPERGGDVRGAQQAVEYTSEGDNEHLLEDSVPMDPISGSASVMPPKPNPRSKIVAYEAGALKPQERKCLPSSPQVLMSFFETVATPVRFPRSPGLDPSPLWLQIMKDVEEGRYDTKIWKTPVMSLMELAARLGRGLDSTAMAARQAGLYVLGQQEKYVTKVPWITASRVLGKQQDAQIASNKDAVQVVSKKTDLLVKTLKHKVKAEGVAVELVVNKDYLPVIHGRGWKPDRNVPASLNSLIQTSAYVHRIKSTNVMVGDVQMTETVLAMARPGSKDFRWYMKRIGPSTKENVASFYHRILNIYHLNDLERALMRGDEATPRSWHDTIEQEERARLYDSSGLSFVIRGEYLYPVNARGSWLTVDKMNRAELGGVLWKQRRGETLVAYAKRTSQRLKGYGHPVDFETLTVSKTPIPKSKKLKRQRDA